MGRTVGDIPYIVVKRGDVIAAYCARFAPEAKLPFVLGERHRIQIPHQHRISPKYGGWRLQAQIPIYKVSISQRKDRQLFQDYTVGG